MSLTRIRRLARPAALALALTLSGCSADGIHSPQKFFPGRDRLAWADCGKFVSTGSTPQVCAAIGVLPGNTEAAYVISFFVPNEAHVRISVYDQSAKLVKVLLDQDEPATPPDTYRQPPVEWDFTDREGRHVPPGDYRVYFRADDFLTASDVEVP